MIQLYLNECGILSLYEPGDPLVRIYEHYDACKCYCGNGRWKDTSFYRQPDFFRILNDKNIEPQWRGLLKEFYYGSEPLNDWRGPNRKSNPSEIYNISDGSIAFTDVTVAEAAETAISQSDHVLLLSVKQSKLGNHNGEFDVRRSDGVVCKLYNVVSSAAAIITNLRGIYSETTQRAPKAFETILGKRRDLFKRTNRKAPKGAIFYEETSTGHLFYLDTFHRGRAAHLEVFSAIGKHLGEADIDTAEIVEGTADANKNIVL